MTPRWNATLDALDLNAERCDEAVGELYAGRDEWEPEEVPTWDEL